MMGSKETGPPKKVYREAVTPHRLTLAVLIKNFCQYRDSTSFKNIENESLKCEYRRNFCVLILKLLQSPDLSLEELQYLLKSSKYNIPEEVITAFNDELASINDGGTDQILDTVDTFSRTMTYDNTLDTNRSFITKNSVLGYYFRRLIVNFDKLTFSEVTRVFLAFQHYYHMWKISINRSPAINNVQEVFENWSSTREQWSKRQAELFIATQAALLMNNEDKALSPSELQKRISALLKTNSNISEAHFLSYLNYLRIKEFCGALESIHHCFDKSAVMDSKTFDEKSKGYRFAALNLAILHYHFGHHEEALASLKEAIKMSQKVNDNICLQHALSWLVRLSTVNKDKLIVHCVSKSIELNLTYTTSLGIQTMGQCGYYAMIGMPLAIFEMLTKSDIINCQQNHIDLISNSYALKSSLWQFFGKTEMCSLWSQLLLHLNVDCNSPSQAYYGEGFCLAVCNVANQLLLEGHYSLVHSVLSFIKFAFPKEPHSLIWMFIENLYTFTRSLYHEKWTEAESAAQKILVIDKWEGYLRLAELNLYKEEYEEANAYVDVLLKEYESCEKNKVILHQYIRGRILLAEIQFASCFPHNTPSGILNILNSCLIDTKKAKLDYQTAIIHLHLANILLMLNLHGQALKVLDRALIQIFAHGGCYDRGRAMLLFVKCIVADLNRHDENVRNEIVAEAADILNKVKENFEKVEAYSRLKDVLYLQAHYFHMLNKTNEKNKCAMEYRLLDEAYVTKNCYTLTKYV